MASEHCTASGMSVDALQRAGAVLSAAVQNDQCSAASMVVSRGGTTVFSGGFGDRGYGGDTTVDADSIFLLASITKLLTGCAMMLMVDRGLVSLDDPVTKYLPEFRPTGAALDEGAPVRKPTSVAAARHHVYTT